MWLDVPFEKASPLIGAPPDHLKLIFILLTSYPLAHIFIRIPNSQRTLKHLFSIVLTSFYLVGLFRMKWGFVQLVADAMVTWGLAVAQVGVKDGKGQGWMPWLVFAIIMAHLTINHAYRAFTDIPDSEMEITAMQMVTTMKLITFAWNVEDGRSSPTTLDPALLATRLTPDRVPSLLAFLGYVLFFPSLVGPTSDYASYEALIDGSIFVFPPGTNEASRRAVKDNQKSLDGTSNGSPSAVPGEEDEDVQAVVSATKTASSRVRIPKRRKTVAYRKLVTGLVMLGLYSTFGSVWGYGRIIEEGAWWSGKSVFGKWIYVMRAGFTARTKYYALWSISEGACILTGIGFNGYTTSSPPTELWDRVQNIDIWNIETAQSFKVLFDSWNCRANVGFEREWWTTFGLISVADSSFNLGSGYQVWLRDTIYKRLVKPGQKAGFGPTVMTFVTSAFWHGIAPGYYLAFITAGVCTSLGRQMRHLVRPFFLPENNASKSTTPKLIYDILSWLTVQSLLSYFVAAFLLLSWHDCLLVWTRMGWVGHILIGTVWAGLKYGGAGWLKGMNAKAGRAGGVKKSK